jgi:selenocysteine-specific elongation factor
LPHIIIGTAGHIDHGKTSLVKALTGVDTDRLPEEKARGLTIDLGFAHLGAQATIIDVPGHEKFIRNMVAGVSTIDLVLFVIAADDGVMPQTQEHLDILKILQVQHGIIVITKIDLVEGDWLKLVKEDLRQLVRGSFLEQAVIVPVSSTTGQGISELKSIMQTQFAKIKQKPDRGIFWMPIDRSFTMKGFGTVVTGSVLSGQTAAGDTLELLPQRRLLKIRGLQSHGKTVARVATGDRAAINLPGIDKASILRGDVLAQPNYFKPSECFNASLQLLRSAPRPLKANARVRLHFGTTEVMARISILSARQLNPGDKGYVQFYLEKPAAARRLDPYVIRQYSPTVTLGGGVILEANASRLNFSDTDLLPRLQVMEKENPLEILETKLLLAKFSLLTVEQLTSELAVSPERIEQLLNESLHKIIWLKKGGQTAVVHTSNVTKLKEELQRVVSQFHAQNPTRPGLRKSELARYVSENVDEELLNYVLDNFINETQFKETAGLISLSAHKLQLSQEQENLRKKINQLLFEQTFATSSVAEMAEHVSAKPEAVSEVLNVMIDLGEAIRVEGDIYFHIKHVAEAQERLIQYLHKNKEITISQFKDLLGGVSRKYAMPLLRYFDGLGITERVGDVRILGNA